MHRSERATTLNILNTHHKQHAQMHAKQDECIQRKLRRHTSFESNLSKVFANIRTRARHK